MTDVSVPQPGPHGGDAERLAAALGVEADDVLDLSVNLNPCAPDVVSLVRDHAASVERYPDPARATEVLADAIGVDASQVLLTNGGAEAIALLAAEQPVGWVDEPDFSLYRRHLRLDRAGPRWRSNPHNPSGLLAGSDEHAAVWDEAFYPLATGTWTRGDRDASVVGSLTKLFACPGLRIGYLLAAPDVVDRVRLRQPQWSVNALACAVLPALLERCDLTTWSQSVADLRAQLVVVLGRCGLDPEPSAAPYVLARDARGLREHLARQGVLVRDTGSFGIPDGVRIAVPAPDGLERLGDALDGWKR